MKLKGLMIFVLLMTLIACGHLEDRNSISTVKPAKDKHSQDNESLGNELLQPTLPESSNLSFTPLDLHELKEEDPQESWEFVKSIPFGVIDNKNVILHVYKETNENNRCGFTYNTISLLDYDGKTYGLQDCTSTSLLNETLGEFNEIFVFEESYEYEDEHSILLAGIELAANGPGRMGYFMFDKINKIWYSFEDWGIPFILDLDSDETNEFLIQFPGLHMSWPDVTIYRWNQGKLEVSSSLKKALDIAENQQNEVVIVEQDGQMLFKATIVIDQEQDSILTANYRYDNGDLVLIKE